MDTLVVNFFAGPGAGKSTIAASLFANLKWQGVNCELVTEYAKDKVWQEHATVFDNQVYLFAKQYYKLSSVLNKVDIVITDAPLLLPIIYQKEQIPFFKAFVLGRFYSFRSLNFLLERGDKKYNEVGRNQNSVEAKYLDNSIRVLLDDNGIPYTTIPWKENKFLIDSEILQMVNEEMGVLKEMETYGAQ